MSKIVKIALFGAVLAACVAMLYFVLVYPQQFKRYGVPGPEVTALGHTWQTTLVENDDPEHSKTAVHAIFEAPASFDPKVEKIGGRMLIELCNVIGQNARTFDQGGLVMSDFGHVDLNVRIGAQKAFPFDVTVNRRDGACINSFYFAQSDRDATKTASNHSAQEEANAIFGSWGVTMGGPTFSVGTGGRKIVIEYSLAEEFQREIAGLDANALCIVALMNMDEKVNFFVTKVDPSTYEKMEIKVTNKKKTGAVSYTSKSAAVTLALDNGRCGARVDG